jgi:hypothetical protein
MPTAVDLVTDLPADFEVFGQAVDTSLADLKGGTSGQILAKNTNADMDFVWITNDVGDITAVTAGTGISGGGTSGAVTITNSMATEITAKGDLIVGTGNAAFDNLPVGTNNHVLMADSTVSPTGLKWASVAAEGPTFYAYLSSNQTVTAGVITKVQCNTEEYDLGSNYDNATNYRFTPTTPGIYQFNFVTTASGSGGTTIWVYKNGSAIREGARTAGAGAPMGFSTQLSMNGTTDYVEFFAQVAAGTLIYGGQATTGFGAAYLRRN